MSFDYFEPTSLDAAREILRNGMGGVKALSGGTDVVIQLRRRVVTYRGLVNLKRIPGMREWQYEPGTGLTIGACTPMRDLEISSRVREGFTSIWEALRVVGSVQLRNLASVGGNLCNASPSADTAPPLIVLGATVSLLGDGSAPQSIPVQAFFRGPGASVLGTTGVLLSVAVPEQEAMTGDAFERFTPRSAMDIAIASAAAQVTVHRDGGGIRDVRIALGAVAPTPRRAESAEEWLKDKQPTPEVLEEAGRRAMGDCSPIDDIRGTGEYRRELVRVLVKRVVLKSVKRARAKRVAAG